MDDPYDKIHDRCAENFLLDDIQYLNKNYKIG
jgi:hypothetical protein